MKSDDDGTFDDEPTGQFPVASSSDPRVTITGAEHRVSDLVDETPRRSTRTRLLPHWTDAPTGQVPIVVARETAKNDDPWSAVPAPAWREGEADWVAHEDQFDASILAGEEKVDDARPWEFSLSEETTGRRRRRPGRRSPTSRAAVAASARVIACPPIPWPVARCARVRPTTSRSPP